MGWACLKVPSASSKASIHSQSSQMSCSSGFTYQEEKNTETWVDVWKVFVKHQTDNGKIFLLRCVNQTYTHLQQVVTNVVSHSEVSRYALHFAFRASQILQGRYPPSSLHTSVLVLLLWTCNKHSQLCLTIVCGHSN